MAGEARKTKSVFVKAPIDGVNLIAGPTDFLPTEARELENYFVYDWGIRERPPETFATTKTFSHITQYTGQGAVAQLMGYSDSDTKMYSTSTAFASVVDKTGAVAITSHDVGSVAFNKRIFFMNAKDQPWIYDIVAGGNCAVSNWTGPYGGGKHFRQGWNFKNRVYFLETNTTSNPDTPNPTRVWYGGVGAISGTMESIDFAQVLDNAGPLMAGCSWGYNQGQQSDELFVLISVAGELLFYSGDWPGAANFQLIARAKIPSPNTRNCFLKIGQEILVSTYRGLIPLSRAFAGRSEGIQYVALSSKLGTYGAFTSSDINTYTPFLYGSASGIGPRTPTSAAGQSQYYIWCQNYERGAWSALTVEHQPACLITYGDLIVFSTPLGGAGTYYIQLRDAGTAPGESSATAASRCSWKTPFFDLGSALHKSVKSVRLLGQDLCTDTNSLRSTAWVKADHDDNGATPTTGVATKATTTTARVTMRHELNPPGSGEDLSICLTKIPTGERNELYGFKLRYEEGGAL